MMKRVTFSQKILLVLMTSLAFTVLFSFFFLHFLYSELYLKSIEQSITHQGSRLASHYEFDPNSDEGTQPIDWYNTISEYEVIVVDQLDDLTNHFPYQINYKHLIDEQDYKKLQMGDYVLKEGFVEEFNREIFGGIFPILKDEKLDGFIYVYVPLDTLKDVFKQSIPLLLVVGTIFFFILFLIVNRVWTSLFKPLRKLQQMSLEVSKGNFSARCDSERHDEVGDLARAFNTMSRSLEEQEKRKREFTSNMMHELRTPLTYISGYTHALQNKVYDSPEEAKQYLETIHKEVERLNELMNDLIQLNHLQEELYTLEKEPVAVAQLVFDTIDLLTILMNEKQVTLRTSIDEDAIVLGDPNRLQQVFYNTIDNAIKYMDEAGSLTISLKETKQSVIYQVTNTGPVILDEDLAQIGERFFRTDRARTRTTGGTGLGLSIVKEIVHLHEGTFTMTSEPVIGTTVTIELPKLSFEDSIH